MSPPVLVAYAPCWMHGGLFGFDPDRVTSLLIDPETGNPPDVDPATAEYTGPDPERVARSRREPVCPACCKRLNQILARRGLPAKFDETDTSGGQVQE